jgi:PEP-CTERM motif
MSTTQQQGPILDSEAPDGAFSSSFAKRLASYTAAASLGAFSYGEAAHADIVHVDLGTGIVHDSADSFSSLDLDSNGTVDFLFGRSTGAYGGVRLIVYGHPGSPEGGGFVPPFDPTLPADERSQNFTNSPAKGNAYYIRSFEFGNSIGPGSTMPMHQIGPYSPFVNFTGAVSTNATNFRNPDAPQYWGFGLNIDGDIHYGWGRLSTFNNAGVWTATLHEYAYQSEPGVPILAGSLPQIPEPTTLALLAAGGGGIALASRRKQRD